MARPIILGNSQLTIGLNEDGFVHDFYYPYVGLENLTTARCTPHHLGVWIDGDFSWLSDRNDWEIQMVSNSYSLSARTHYTSKKHAVVITSHDFVDHEYNVFFRNITIENKSDVQREMRLFTHQKFEISADGRGDTAMYVPDGHYMLDYKGSCSILAYLQDENGVPFDQYAAGNSGIEGKEGTFKDAEDGELSMSAVEHSGVDSTMRCVAHLEAGQSHSFEYWLAVADSQDELESLHSMVLSNGLESRRELNEEEWQKWLQPAMERMENVAEEDAEWIRKSLMIIKAHSDLNGGVIASCDSSIYNYGRDYYSYVWPRDGAYAMWPLIRLGYTEEPKSFFLFCRDVIKPDGYMMHKYQSDQAIGSTWHPLVHGNRKELAIQEDETALVIIMLSEYLHFSGDLDFIAEVYGDLVQPAANFMARFIDQQTGLPHASYDLWEEKFLSTTYTAALTARALVVAAALGEQINEDADVLARWNKAAVVIEKNANTLFDSERGAYSKGILLNSITNETDRDSILDISSFYGPWRFVYGDRDKVDATIAKINEVFADHTVKGLPRYENDAYFKKHEDSLGNPWLILQLWMSQYYSDNGNLEKARQCIDWVQERALETGALPEQSDPESLDGVGVSPLVWSHAEIIHALLDISNAQDM